LIVEWCSVWPFLSFRIVDHNSVQVRGFVVVADPDGLLKLSNGPFLEGGGQFLRVLS